MKFHRGDRALYHGYPCTILNVYDSDVRVLDTECYNIYVGRFEQRLIATEFELTPIPTLRRYPEKEIPILYKPGDIVRITHGEFDGKFGVLFEPNDKRPKIWSVYIFEVKKSFLLKESEFEFMEQKNNYHYPKVNYTTQVSVPRHIGIFKVIFSDPATIVIWDDKTKTVVKAQNESYDPEKGLAMCIAKKYFGNDREYYTHFKKWLTKYDKELKRRSNK